jgi:hypothetical protein
MYWLPLIIRSMLPTDLTARSKETYSILLTAVPYTCSAGDGPDLSLIVDDCS